MRTISYEFSINTTTGDSREPIKQILQATRVFVEENHYVSKRLLLNNSDLQRLKENKTLQFLGHGDTIAALPWLKITDNINLPPGTARLECDAEE